ncbi:MAG: hypothetical protein ACHQ2Y_07285 [Candidatus Lutacidiplasmatales archaeon]
MSDPGAALAKAVLAKNLKVKKGESVVIEAWTHMLPYIRPFVQEARRLGAHPTVIFEEEGAWWDAVKAKQFDGFKRLSPVERSAVSAADVFLYFWGPGDRPRVWKLPESTQNRVTGYNDEWYKVAHKAGLRGCRMSIGQASDPAARFYGLDGPGWRARLLKAGAEDVGAMRKKGERIVKALDAGSELRIRHANGTDLTLKLNGLHSRIELGVVSREALKRPFGMLTNNPSGQVMVALDASEATGNFVSNRAVYLGEQRYTGVRWTFDGGMLTAHSLKEGREAFEVPFAKAGKGKDQLGYLSIGLNPSARDLPPCEDAEEGSVLVGIGSNVFVGGKIRIPFQSYALVGEPQVEIDGMTVAERGRVR